MPKRTLVRRIAVALGAMAAIAGAAAPAMWHYSAPVSSHQALQNWSAPNIMHI